MLGVSEVFLEYELLPPSLSALFSYPYPSTPCPARPRPVILVPLPDGSAPWSLSLRYTTPNLKPKIHHTSLSSLKDTSLPSVE